MHCFSSLRRGRYTHLYVLFSWECPLCIYSCCAVGCHVCICNYIFHLSWGGCVFLSLYILYIYSIFTVSVFVLASCRMFSFPCLLCFHMRWSLFLNLQHISLLGHSNVFVNVSHCRYYDNDKYVIILLLYQQLTYLQLIKWVIENIINNNNN